ncbi:MAG: hypothetical protein GZ085_11210 [Sulfuriferula multivorans]|uniref:Uncharacterized protein n=1 Tax=Sulfuriferula multivorans TaxID=1559896 RepID=A0A7C9P8U3_9PROT|nr:hypothetical protein [Sulfuriferula multivorans]
MSLYRATPKLVNRIMTGRVPVRAFVVGFASDNATPGDPGVTGHISGLDLRDLIDPTTRSFSMPTALAPVSDSVTGPSTQCTVRCEIQAHQIGETGQGVLAGQIFMNRYFEADFPSGTAPAWINYLVNNGWLSAAGALTNGSVPAALNVNLPALTSRTGK